MPIRIEIDGQVLNTEDLLVGEGARIEREAGTSWDFILLQPLRSLDAAQALLAGVLRHLGVPDDEAAARAEAVSLKDLMACMEVVPDDRPVEHVDGVPVVDPPLATEGSETT